MASPRPRSPAGGIFEDEAIWRRLREAGFDEETVRRRDKAALVAYITKLESQVHDYQYHMGLLILEKKETTSKYEQLRASTESAEVAYKRDQAAKLSALAEARKQEESLKRALGIEKECVANIEKALHDMRAVSAETKLAYESKLAEARSMMESAQKKFDEAELKLRAAESLHAEATRFRSTASRSLEDVEAREDELRRRIDSFKSECEAKEKDMTIQRQSLHDRQKVLHQEQGRLLEGQTLLNQRQEYILERSNKSSCFSNELEKAKAKLEEEGRALKDERSNLDLDKEALANREEAVIKREASLDRRERELLLLQESISSKEYEEIQRLTDENQSALETKLKELEAEVEQRHLLMTGEINVRITSLDDKEADLNRREDVVQQKELSLKSQLSSLAEKEEMSLKRSTFLEEKELELCSTKRALEMDMLELEKERNEIKLMKVDMEKMKCSLDDRKKEILHERENLELSMSERTELLVLETKLKEEIDHLRAERKSLMAEADKLKADKEKFEIEWELIDEKREELRKEAEGIAEERNAASNYLKNEHASLQLEKEKLRNQFKENVGTLSHEREEFMRYMEREHSDWFNKIQKEREDFAKDIIIQRKELENRIEKRREEIETYLRERKESFEEERARELQHLNAQKEVVAKNSEYVESELRKLNNERAEIALDRNQRESEWSEIKSSIELLNIQREKLQKQRELLHADREEIFKQIQHLKKLEDLNIESENRALSATQTHHLSTSIWKVPAKKSLNNNVIERHIDDLDQQRNGGRGGGCITPKLLPEKTPSNASPPISATISWIRKVIFRHSPEKDASSITDQESKLPAEFREVSLGNGIKSQKDMRFKGHENTRIKEIPPVTSNLEESYAKTAVPQLGETGGIVPDPKPGNGASEEINQLREDVHEDITAKLSGSVNSSGNLLFTDKKRLHNLISQDNADGLLEPIRKYRKKKQKGRLNVEERSPNCVQSVEPACSDDESGTLESIRSLGCKETPASCMDRDQDTSKLSIVSPTEASENGVFLRGSPGNGEIHGSKNILHVCNGISSSYSQEIVDTQEKTIHAISKELEKTTKLKDFKDGTDADDSESKGGEGVSIKE